MPIAQQDIITEDITHDIINETVQHSISEEVVSHIIEPEQGPPGPQGPVGGTGLRNFTHEQSTALSTWTCNHNLGFIPNIQIEDTLGDLVLPDRITHGINQSIIYFAISMAGKAHLS